MPMAITTHTLTRKTRELFAAGQRTVSFRDLTRVLDKEYDADTQAKIVALLPDIASELEAHGFPVTLVNEYCLRNWAESPVTTMAEARRCNVFNSGGKDPVGIRRAGPDDLVRPEYYGSQLHLGMGSVASAVRDNVNDVARGISARETHDRLVSTVRARLPEIAEQQPDPQQVALPGDDDDGETG
jgi:hypothetical protein